MKLISEEKLTYESGFGRIKGVKWEKLDKPQSNAKFYISRWASISLIWYNIWNFKASNNHYSAAQFGSQ